MSEQWGATTGWVTVRKLPGRERFLEEVATLIKEHNDPGMVLTGPAFCGKTTLLKYMAGRTFRQRLGQCWSVAYVNLSPASQWSRPESFWRTVFSLAGIEHSGLSVEALLKQLTPERRLLVLCDRAEQFLLDDPTLKDAFVTAEDALDQGTVKVIHGSRISSAEADAGDTVMGTRSSRITKDLWVPRLESVPGYDFSSERIRLLLELSAGHAGLCLHLAEHLQAASALPDPLPTLKVIGKVYAQRMLKETYGVWFDEARETLDWYRSGMNNQRGKRHARLDPEKRLLQAGLLVARPGENPPYALSSPLFELE